MSINIAIAGGSCQGKSTLAAQLYAALKADGFDYDLVLEQYRSLKNEMGGCRSSFDQLYMWRQQEREELRSSAEDGFITDAPLFFSYIQAKVHAREKRDLMAVRELFRMCMEIGDRYQLIVLPSNPDEIPYKKDYCRRSSKAESRRKHHLVRSYLEHAMPERIVWVKGSPAARVRTIKKKLLQLRLKRRRRK